VTVSPARSPSATAVRVLEEVHRGTGCERRLQVSPASDDCLAGHFPGVPVVPGFVQIGWVVDAAQALAGRRLAVRRVEGLRFQRLLRPLDVVQLTVERAGAGPGVDFRLWNADHVFAAGRLVLEAEA
jgi:3-hydroxymyristoyl/3-hydroxydecanoyl-(acyl carrier protein) dehydratase